MTETNSGKAKSIRILVLLTVLSYEVFHVTEEAVGKFPLFMQQNWGIPEISYGQWLYHNIVFFLPVLLVAYIVFSQNETRFLPFGLGISFWGGMNFCEHLFYTIKNGAVSPGFFSSLLFVALLVVTLATVKKSGNLRARTVLLSVGAAVLYWGISIGLILLLAQRVSLIFA